jgi:hypothetical protein
MLTTTPLRSLPLLARLGLTAVLFTLLGGLAASGMFLYQHYEKRDERAGLGLDDLRSAYHGLDAPAPIAAALRRGHPEGLAEPTRDALLKWLEGGKVSEQYDSLDLGPAAPAELLAKSCVECHSRKSSTGDAAARRLPLENWDDVKKAAFARKIDPVPLSIVAISTHTHAIALATLSFVVFGLSMGTRWPRGLVGGLMALAGLGLMLDIAGWWLARLDDRWVFAIAGGGGAFQAGLTLLLVLVLVDLWWPARRA